MKNVIVVNDSNYSEFESKVGMSFKDAYTKYNNKLKWFIQKMVKDDVKADDYVTDSFIKSLENINKYNAQYHDGKKIKFDTWLFCVAKNLIKDDFKKKKRHFFVSIDEQIGTEDFCLGDTLTYQSTDNHHNDYLISKKSELIIDAITKIDKQHQKILEMREIDNMRYEDISEALNINMSTTKSRIKQGRIKVMKLVKKEFEKLNNLDDKIEYNYTIAF